MRKEKNHIIGKAVLRGSARKARTTSLRRKLIGVGSGRKQIVSIHHKYTISDEKHKYNPGQMKGFRKGVQGTRIVTNDALGGTSIQSSIIKEEGKLDNIRGEVRNNAYRKVRKSTSVRINGRELSRRTGEGIRTTAGVGSVSLKKSYANIGKDVATIGQADEIDRSANDANRFFNNTADKAEAAVGRFSLKTRHEIRREEKIDKLEQRLEKTGKKLYRADKKMGKGVKQTRKAYLGTIKDLKNEGVSRGALLRGNLGSGGLRGGLKGILRGTNTTNFLRADARVIGLGRQKTSLMNQRSQIISKLNILKKKRFNPLQSLIRKMLLGVGGTLLIFALPIVILFIGLGNAGGGSKNVSLSFRGDTVIIASYLYEHQSELWTRNESDVIRICAVLGAISAQTTEGYNPIRISHTYTADAASISKFIGKKNITGSGWQGLCGWTNEELAAFIETEKAEERYAGYEDDQKTADLYTQIHYLDKKLQELKTYKEWTDDNLTIEQASVISFYHLILQSDEHKYKWKNASQWELIAADEMISWSYLYTLIYLQQLSPYDIWAADLAKLNLSNPNDRMTTCYPTQGSVSYEDRSKYVVPVTLPSMMLIKDKDASGNAVMSEMSTDVLISCHWMIASRMYEAFYEAKQEGYRLSESCTCFVDDPEHPQSPYTLGLAISINRDENTPDTNGECHESNWGSVIDDRLAEIFKNHGFYWSNEKEPAGPKWEFSFI